MTSVLNSGVAQLKSKGGIGLLGSATAVRSKFIDQQTDNGDLILQVSAGHGTRLGLLITASSPALNDLFEFLKFKLSKHTLPAGNYQITLRDSADSVKFTKNFDVTLLPSTKDIIEHDLDSPFGAIVLGDRILFEYGGDAGVKMYGDTLAGVAGFSQTLYNYTPVYVDDSAQASVAIIDSQA